MVTYLFIKKWAGPAWITDLILLCLVVAGKSQRSSGLALAEPSCYRHPETTSNDEPKNCELEETLLPILAQNIQQSGIELEEKSLSKPYIPANLFHNPVTRTIRSLHLVHGNKRPRQRAGHGMSFPTIQKPYISINQDLQPADFNRKFGNAKNTHNTQYKRVHKINRYKLPNREDTPYIYHNANDFYYVTSAPRYQKSTTTQKPNLLWNISPHYKNIVFLGQLDAKMEHQIRKCGSHISLDLLGNYSLGELTYSRNSLRELLVYINVKEMNDEAMIISLERIKRIFDHLVVRFNGLTVYNLYPYEEQFLNETKGYKPTDQKRLLLDMNDHILDYCANIHPSCKVLNSLKWTLRALYQSYLKSKGLNRYPRTFLKESICLKGTLCRESLFPNSAPKSGRPQIEQLNEFSQALCLSPHHRIVEFVLNAKFKGPPLTYETEIYETTGIIAQTGLVLQDILPLELKMYDKNRPPKYEAQPTIVYFHVTVLSVDSINEESMTYVADIFLAQSWRDHRLRLPENMTEEYRILDVEWLHNIWRPDCFFKNAKQVTFHEMSVPNHYLWLYHDKTLLYMTKLTLVLSCAMKFETYPHDTQICSMMIESLSHTTYDLIFKWNETDPLVVNPDIELPQLDISRNYTEDCTLTYSTGNFTCLAIVFNMRRRLGYHLFHTYIPSAITVVMSWISFWIKPEAIPARVTLGVTSLLTLATQNQQSQSSLPPVSYIKAIDVWMSSCTVFVFASLLEFGIVNHFVNCSETPSKSSNRFSIEDISESEDRKMSEDWSSHLQRRRSRSRSRMRSMSPGYPQYIVTRCTEKDVAVLIDKFSRVFFPMSFCILNISYWTIYGSL